MLEFLRVVESDPDLALLWREIISITDHEKMPDAILVFSDRLEEVGWADEAAFLRRSTVDNFEYLPERLSFPGATPFIKDPKIKDSTVFPFRKTCSSGGDTFKSCVGTVLRFSSMLSMGIDAGKSLSDPYIATVCCCNALPRAVWFHMQYLPIMLKWFDIFLRRLPITHVVTSIPRFSRRFMFDQSVDQSAESGSLITTSMHIPILTPHLYAGEQCSDNNVTYRVFSEHYAANTSYAVRGRRFGFWLSWALQVKVGINDVDETVAFMDFRDKDQYYEYDVFVDEADRFREDFNLDTP